MYENFISERLAKLRLQKGISARDMSLSIGQNTNYINQIENNKALPSMQVFYYICEYLDLTPQEFFDEKNDFPSDLKDLIDNLKKLDENSLLNINGIVQELVKQKIKK